MLFITLSITWSNNHNLKKYDTHLIVKENVKINFKINVIPNGLEKYMSFSLDSLY